MALEAPNRHQSLDGLLVDLFKRTVPMLVISHAVGEDIVGRAAIAVALEFVERLRRRMGGKEGKNADSYGNGPHERVPRLSSEIHLSFVNDDIGARISTPAIPTVVRSLPFPLTLQERRYSGRCSTHTWCQKRKNSRQVLACLCGPKHTFVRVTPLTFFERQHSPE